MKRQYKVLCVGLDQVPGKPWKKLYTAEKSAYAAARYFKALGSHAQVTHLTGDQARKSEIFKWLVQCNSINQELTVILYFAGHASVCENKKNTKWQRCLWILGDEQNSTHPEAHQLKTPEVMKILANPIHRLIMIIDTCCHLEHGISRENMINDIIESERMTSLKQYVVLSNTLQQVYQHEEPELGYGILTYYMLQILSGQYTFFLKRKIAFFKFLEILHHKVKGHGITPRTRRNSSDYPAIQDGIMVHLSHKGFYFPILEPVPFIDDYQNAFQKRWRRWIYFFTCTRLRAKVYKASRILIILLLLLYLVHLSVVRIYFEPRKHVAAFHGTMMGNHCFFITDLTGNMLDRKDGRNFNIYLFKPDWIKNLLDKLDENGKIVLLGNFLGDKMSIIDDYQIMTYALSHSDYIFFWHPDDVTRLLKTIREKYDSLNFKQKTASLGLLAKLGEKGKAVAVKIFDFKKESNREIRDLFLRYFSSLDLLKKNIHHLNPHDHLFLLNNKKNILHSMDKQLLRKTEQHLNSISSSIPDTALQISNTLQQEKINDKLRILAAFGSQRFRQKASHIFKNPLAPKEVFYLVDSCKNTADKIWILEQYFMKVENMNFPFWVWQRFFKNYIKILPPNRKTKVAKLIVNNKLNQVPKEYWYDLFDNLLNWDSQMVTLTDWSAWLRTYHFEPMNLLYSIIDKNKEDVFPFLENHCKYFENYFTKGVFEALYERNKNKTLQLAKQIFKVNTREDQLHAAVFLYSKNCQEYLSFILEYLEKAKNNRQYQQSLYYFFGTANDTIIKIISQDEKIKEDLKSLLDDPEFFYNGFKTNIRIWAKEVTQRIVTAEIPLDVIESARFFKMFKLLPKAHRKKMLFKICSANVHEIVKRDAETILAREYPQEFLELAFNGKYNLGRYYIWDNYGQEPLVIAYQSFSYEALIEELITNLRKKNYQKVDFICKALVNSDVSDKQKIQTFERILNRFNHPYERITMRQLRYYLHKCNLNLSYSG